MGAGVVRIGDVSSHGGRMITASANVNANGASVGRSGDLHRCPIVGHGTTPVNSTSAGTKVNGAGILRIGDRAGCGAIITGGSSNVISS